MDDALMDVNISLKPSDTTSDYHPPSCTSLELDYEELDNVVVLRQLHKDVAEFEGQAVAVSEDNVFQITKTLSVPSPIGDSPLTPPTRRSKTISYVPPHLRNSTSSSSVSPSSSVVTLNAAAAAAHHHLHHQNNNNHLVSFAYRRTSSSLPLPDPVFTL
ncbi:hypothetical protein LWI28_023726 [Acer negundo]|uniref:Uncharacterized protein n=1 Tax=Acer negundo TaxID=4023 RepID=A0AAD5IR82_ACENE|nr:hypothetical protein LWI28_023726 [Acer negundo]